MRGSLSGSQKIAYDSGAGYDIPEGTKESAVDYKPILVAKVTRRFRPDAVRFYQIRTKTTVNMTTKMRTNLAIMGGAAALYAALVRDKTAAIYADVVAVKPMQLTLRAFVMPLLRAGLRDKVATIAIADGVGVVNPWVSSDTPNVPVTQAVLDKFASILSNP